MQTDKLGLPLRWDHDLSLVRSQRVCPGKTSYTCPTVLSQIQAFNQQVQSSQDETEEKLCLPNPSSCANMYLSLMCTSTRLQFTARQHKTSLLLWEWRPLRWWASGRWYGRAWGALFLATGFPMNYQGKENAVQPHRWAGLRLQAVDMKNCPKMVFPAEDQFLLWNWFFSENSLGWRNQPQEGLHCSHFFPSDFLHERQDVSCIWF